ncbi:MAG: four-carbon acid sugar kinase family protein [Aliihoeflea sp.]|uniref:four-carbon acid sugar kinase family protein n=1 Tax=Aliihoeflea sp. TaxID=2608088 RepID=UPI00403332BC
MTTLGIIADDFTGGLMIAGYIEAAGIECPVLFDTAHLDDALHAPVVVVATRTRLIPAGEALAEVRRIVGLFDASGIGQVGYKVCASFDSTDEGNIGPVADFLADRYGQAQLLLSAGFPRFNTTMHQGYLFYRGRLVSESIKRFDPLTPMSDPDMVRTLARQTAAKVGLLAHGTLVKGEAAAKEALAKLADEGVRHVLMDCSDDADAAAGAALAAGHRATIGSDAHIIEVAKLAGREAAGARPAAPEHAKGPAAVIVGSVGPVATTQLAAFGALHPVHTIDIMDHRPEDVVAAEVLAKVRGDIGARPFAVATATGPEDVERAQAIHGALKAARRAERILALVAAGLVDLGVRRLAVAGGETSGAIVEELGIGQVRALPESELGTGFCIAEGPRKLSLYLKPGKLGADDILLRAVEAMD